jgi:ribonuclease P protein component
VLERGAQSSGPMLTVRVLPTGRPTRVGFVCGRRFGGAVERNRGRRIMRAAWGQLVPRVVDGYDIVIVARTGAVTASSREAGAEMERALRSLGALAP